ncbi:MAG: GNAT family N-acetyltransferase [Coriobacteriia bacterium]|nr:GNAT family N-acetyltransferase [Coriobacteriia bacterium]MBN2847927.1 GNAT family N-acetyltransferase [Coriobacteriia bacterium]
MSDFPLVTLDLARRIERMGVDDLAAYAAEARASGIYPDATTFRIGGGAAYWYSPGNIVNGSFGLGMSGPVEQEEIAALIAFFEDHGESASVNVCPYADPSLRRWLAEYGFVATDFETVLYQPLCREVAEKCGAAEGGAEGAPAVRLASTAAERELWATLEARGFTDDVADDAGHVLARAIALRTDSLPFIGSVDGEPAGTGMLVIKDGVAMFNGDSTLPAMRGRGVQTAILAHRLAYAREAGCDLAVIEASPGGISERNQQRAGFRVAYTRVSLERARTPLS